MARLPRLALAGQAHWLSQQAHAAGPAFADDADRRAFWKGLFADPEFMAFAAQLRPLLQSQENKLMMAAPWGPHP